jgi:cytochrome P450
MTSPISRERPPLAAARAATAPRLPAPPIVGLLGQWRADPLAVLRQAHAFHPELAHMPTLVDLLNIYIVTSASGARHVLQENQANYKKGMDYQRMSPLLGEGLLTANGETWRAHRRLAQPAFHKQRLAAFGAQMLTRTDAMLARWRALPAGHTLDLHAEMMRLTLEIVGEALFSTELGPFVDAISGSLEVLLRMSDERINQVIAWPTWVPTPFNRKLMKHVAVLDHIVEDMILRRIRDGGPEDDLLGMLISARDEDGGPGLSPRQLRDEVMTLILAGHETTANVLTYTFHLLTHHPEARAALEAAIDAAPGPVSVEGLGRVPLLRMTFEEAMRVYPPAWVVARQSIADDVIAGFAIPKDSVVLVPAYLLHKDPRYWTRPEAFEPRRFEGGEEPRDRAAYLPFGAGPRMCIGKGFAMMELELILHRMLSEVRVESLAAEALVLEPTITMRPADGLPARLAWRR